MKKLLSTLSVTCFALAIQAQFVPGPTIFNAITNTGTWTIAPADGGGAATNVPTTQARTVPIGPSGFGVFVRAYGTNAALTTNTWFVLETSPNGTDWTSNTTLTVVFLPTGVATNQYYTNFNAQTAGLNILNATAVRIKNVMQTNGVIGGSLAGNLFVEKFQINTR